MAISKTFRLTRLPKGKSLGLNNAQAQHLMLSLLEIKQEKARHTGTPQQQLRRYSISSGPANTPQSLLKSLRSCWTQTLKSGKSSRKAR